MQEDSVMNVEDDSSMDANSKSPEQSLPLTSVLQNTVIFKGSDAAHKYGHDSSSDSIAKPRLPTSVVERQRVVFPSPKAQLLNKNDVSGGGQTATVTLSGLCGGGCSACLQSLPCLFLVLPSSLPDPFYRSSVIDDANCSSSSSISSSVNANNYYNSSTSTQATAVIPSNQSNESVCENVERQLSATEREWMKRGLIPPPQQQQVCVFLCFQNSTNSRTTTTTTRSTLLVVVWLTNFHVSFQVPIFNGTDNNNPPVDSQSPSSAKPMDHGPELSVAEITRLLRTMDVSQRIAVVTSMLTDLSQASSFYT